MHPLVRLVVMVSLPFAAGCSEAGPESGDRGSVMITTGVFPEGVDPASIDVALADLVRIKHAATIEQPDSATAWAELADVWLAHARFDLAVEPATRAVELSPGSAKRRLLLAVVLAGAGDDLAAVDVARAAVELDPQNPQLSWRASRFALDAGEIEEARRLATRAASLDPTDSRGLQSLAMVELADGDAAAAIAAIQPLVDRNRGDLPSRFLMGRALQMAGRQAEASRELTVAGDSRPVFVDPWTEEVRKLRVDRNQRIQEVATLAGAGRLEEALQLADLLESRYGADREILFSRVAALAIAGRHEDVIVTADSLIATDPDWAAPRLRAGFASLAIAMRVFPAEPIGLQRARAEGERCVALTPGDPQSHELLGRSLAAGGEWSAALEVFRTCLGMAPSVSRYHIAVGDCLVETGDPLQALNLMRKMNVTFGRSVDAALVESRALASAGKPIEARRLLEECRTALPQHPGIGRTERSIMEAGG